jgi:hypothetical protein
MESGVEAECQSFCNDSRAATMVSAPRRLPKRRDLTSSTGSCSCDAERIMLMMLWALSNADTFLVGIRTLEGCKGWDLDIWDIHIMLTTSRYAAIISGQCTYLLSMWLVSRKDVKLGKSAG